MPSFSAAAHSASPFEVIGVAFEGDWLERDRNFPKEFSFGVGDVPC